MSKRLTVVEAEERAQAQAEAVALAKARETTVARIKDERNQILPLFAKRAARLAEELTRAQCTQLIELSRQFAPLAKAYAAKVDINPEQVPDLLDYIVLCEQLESAVESRFPPPSGRSLTANEDLITELQTKLDAGRFEPFRSADLRSSFSSMRGRGVDTIRQLHQTLSVFKARYDISSWPMLFAIVHWLELERQL